MMYNWLGAGFAPSMISYSVAFLALLVGSVTDLKTREVPDWINYGLIISGIGLNLLFSAIYSDSSFIINSIVGLAIFFGIAYIMFYAGQWGGGDSKMLMGLGAVIGIDAGFGAPQFLAGFFVNVLFIGAAYGLLWSIFLVFRNRHKFSGEFKRILLKKNIVKTKRLMLAALLALFAVLFFAGAQHIKILILSAAFLMLAAFYLWVFSKAVEKSSMHKLVEPQKLTEGDWIVKNVYVNGKYICGPKDLGIGKSQIRKLIEFYNKGKVRKILIKEGIPFVPSFFLAFIAALAFGNPLVWIFGL